MGLLGILTAAVYVWLFRQVGIAINLADIIANFRNGNTGQMDRVRTHIGNEADRSPFSRAMPS